MKVVAARMHKRMQGDSVISIVECGDSINKLAPTLWMCDPMLREHGEGNIEWKNPFCLVSFSLKASPKFSYDCGEYCMVAKVAASTRGYTWLLCVGKWKWKYVRMMLRRKGLCVHISRIVYELC
jgi:hypothetical protein